MTETRPNIDWKQAPKRARWWAMDADGQAHWYSEPDVAAFTNFWFSERAPAPSFGFTGDYKKSLIERPPQGAALEGSREPRRRA